MKLRTKLNLKQILLTYIIISIILLSIIPSIWFVYSLLFLKSLSAIIHFINLWLCYCLSFYFFDKINNYQKILNKLK